MKNLAIVFAVGAAALLGGSAANAADGTVKAKAAADVNQSTDFSSHRRHWRHHRHWRHSHYPRHYRSYGYAPSPYSSPYYYGGGPAISFRFGGGGWGHRHW
jgi:hypothetical protein